MWRHEPVQDRQAGQGRDADLHQGQVELAGDEDDDRHEQDDADLEEQSGIPRMKAISAIIQGSRRGLTPPINRSTIVSDPPESRSNLPIIAPAR